LYKKNNYWSKDAVSCCTVYIKAACRKKKYTKKTDKVGFLTTEEMYNVY
jgi:hypothetical protein